jgi:hypothetical protein
VIEDISYCVGEQDFAFPDVRRPAGTRLVAQTIGFEREAIRRWMDGAEPRHSDGEALLAAWRKLTGKSIDFAPRATPSLSAARMR